MVSCKASADVLAAWQGKERISDEDGINLDQYIDYIIVKATLYTIAEEELRFQHLSPKSINDSCSHIRLGANLRQ